MPGKVCRRIALALAALAAVGCQQNPSTVGQQAPTPLQQQQLAMVQQQQQLQRRTNSLDLDNQELQTKLAQAQQQNKILQDRLTVTSEQFNSTTQQLAESRQQQQATTEQQSQALAENVHRRTATMISANNSLARNLPVINIPGVEVRQDADVVRVELPADRLFNPGTAQLRQDAVPVIDTVAAELQRSYPNQIIGVEGHTDSDPPTMGMSNHQLSMARAGAVFDYLTTRNQFRPQQLFLVGHGANHPVVSNASAQGKARNRRVELVVYPDQWQR